MLLLQRERKCRPRPSSQEVPLRIIVLAVAVVSALAGVLVGTRVAVDQAEVESPDLALFI